MSLKINYNVSAMIANNSLKLNDGKLSTALERLSSGYKINSARDDAAGLAISRRMNAQIKGLKAASQDAKDGASVIEIADGALSEVHDILQRMNELAVKSANGTMVDGDREAIQMEVSALGEEIDRIGQTTEYNSQKLFTGEFDLKGYTDKLAVKVDSYSDANEYGVYNFNIGGLTFKEDNDGNVTLERYMDIQDRKADVLRPDGKHEEYQVSGDMYHLNYKGDNGDEFTLDISGYGYKDTIDGFEDKIKKNNDVIDNAITWTRETDYPKFEYNNASYSGPDYEAAVAEAKSKIDSVEGNLTPGTPTQDSDYPKYEYYEPEHKIKVEINRQSSNVVEYTATTGEKYNRSITVDTTTYYNRDRSVNTTTKVTTTSTTYISADKMKKVTVATGVKEEKIEPDPMVTTNLEADVFYKPTLCTVLDKGTGTYTDSDGNTYARETERTTTIRYDENGNEKGTKTESKINTKYTDTATGQELTVNEEIEKDKEAGQEEKVKTISKERIYKTKTLDLNDDDDKKEAAIKVDLTGYGAMTFQIGANEGQILDIRFEKLSMESLGFKYQDSDQTKDMCLNVGTAKGALKAIDQIKAAIEQVSLMRSRLGAYENRLEHTESNLATSDENMTAAYSRIMDTDMAEEMSNYSNLQIVSQAATAILTQANERPSQMLQLLQ